MSPVRSVNFLAMSGDARLGRDRRLRTDRDFRRVFGARCSTADAVLVVYAAPSPTGRTRVGVRVGRRVGKATRRNRIRRCIREAFRLLRATWPEGYDVVIVARGEAPMTMAEARASLERLVPQAIARVNKRLRSRQRGGASARPPQP